MHGVRRGVRDCRRRGARFRGSRRKGTGYGAGLRLMQDDAASASRRGRIQSSHLAPRHFSCAVVVNDARHRRCRRSCAAGRACERARQAHRAAPAKFGLLFRFFLAPHRREHSVSAVAQSRSTSSIHCPSSVHKYRRSSSAVHERSRKIPANVPRFSALPAWTGTAVRRPSGWPMTWCEPTRRSSRKPARCNARTRSSPSTTGSLGLTPLSARPRAIW
jgi:hypothetical protein